MLLESREHVEDALLEIEENCGFEVDFSWERCHKYMK